MLSIGKNLLKKCEIDKTTFKSIDKSFIRIKNAIFVSIIWIININIVFFDRKFRNRSIIKQFSLIFKTIISTYISFINDFIKYYNCKKINYYKNDYFKLKINNLNIIEKNSIKELIEKMVFIENIEKSSKNEKI